MKKIKIVLAGLLLAVAIAVILTVIMRPEKKNEIKITRHKGYVFDKTSGIKEKDVKIYLSPGDFNAEAAKDYFKDDYVNPYTLRYFFFLDDKFKNSKNIEEVLQKVHDYLYSEMPSPDVADKLYAIYKTYANYQLNLHNEIGLNGTPQTPEEAIEYLHKIQEYRRQVFGAETADALFGPNVKATEYPIRRAMIVEDTEKYGAEKERMLDGLKNDMWGDEADSIDADTEPLNRYNEMLKIYQKDMAEMNSDEERQAKIREFREELFTPEQISRLEDADKMAADDKKNEEDYFAKESMINNDPNLDSDEKAKQITDLQNTMFGTEADAFRRRLVIEKGR
jgi:lipase chaperone LimK